MVVCDFVTVLRVSAGRGLDLIVSGRWELGREGRRRLGRGCIAGGVKRRLPGLVSG